VILALAGPWLLPLFVGHQDAEANAVVSLGTHLLWLSAGYQFFDGLSIGSSMCLRGAGDAIVPALLVLPVLCLVFLPLAHSFTFAPGAAGSTSYLNSAGAPLGMGSRAHIRDAPGVHPISEMVIRRLGQDPV